jgi:hypothetical protein
MGRAKQEVRPYADLRELGGCRSVARATKVRTPQPPHLAHRAGDQHQRSPARSCDVRLCTAIDGHDRPSAGHPWGAHHETRKLRVDLRGVPPADFDQAPTSPSPKESPSESPVTLRNPTTDLGVGSPHVPAHIVTGRTIVDDLPPQNLTDNKIIQVNGSPVQAGSVGKIVINTSPTKWIATLSSLTALLVVMAVAYTMKLEAPVAPVPPPPTGTAQPPTKALPPTETTTGVPPTGDHKPTTVAPANSTSELTLHDRAKATFSYNPPQLVADTGADYDIEYRGSDRTVYSFSANSVWLKTLAPALVGVSCEQRLDTAPADAVSLRNVGDRFCLRTQQNHLFVIALAATAPDWSWVRLAVRFA